MLVGAESALDVPQLPVLVQQLSRAEPVIAPGDDGVDAVPACGLGHLVLIDCGLAVRRNVQEPCMSPRNQAGRLRVFFQPLEQFLKRPLAVVPVLSRTLFRMSHDDALLAVCEGLVPILQLLGLIADVALITVGIQNPLLELARRILGAKTHNIGQIALAQPFKIVAAEQPGIRHHGHPAHIVALSDPVQRLAQRVALVSVARKQLIVQRNPLPGHQQRQHHLCAIRLAVFAVALEAQTVLSVEIFPITLKIQCRGVIEQHLNRLGEKILSPGRDASANAFDHPLVKIVHGLIDPVQIQCHTAVSCQIHDGAALGARLGDARQHQFLDDAVGAVAAGTEQTVPAQVRVKLPEGLAHADAQAVVLAALSDIDAKTRGGATAPALAQKIGILLGREQLLLRIGLLCDLFLDDLAQLHQPCQLGSAVSGADMADDLLSHLFAVAIALHDLHAPSVAVGIEFLSHEHAGKYIAFRADMQVYILLRALHQGCSGFTLAR